MLVDWSSYHCQLPQPYPYVGWALNFGEKSLGGNIGLGKASTGLVWKPSLFSPQERYSERKHMINERRTLVRIHLFLLCSMDNLAISCFPKLLFAGKIVLILFFSCFCMSNCIFFHTAYLRLCLLISKSSRTTRLGYIYKGKYSG